METDLGFQVVITVEVVDEEDRMVETEEKMAEMMVVEPMVEAEVVQDRQPEHAVETMEVVDSVEVESVEEVTDLEVEEEEEKEDVEW